MTNKRRHGRVERASLRSSGPVPGAAAPAGIAGYIPECPPCAVPVFHAVRPGAAAATPARRYRRLEPSGATYKDPDGAHSGLRPLRGGQTYRLPSLTQSSPVTPALASALEHVFRELADAWGATGERPLEIVLGRGYQAGSFGHGEGRALDIYAVGAKSLVQWKARWDKALADADLMDDPRERSAAAVREMRTNLGYRLYKALQDYGGWRVNPGGWRRYRGAEQLFGPWTPTEGPWRKMHIDEPGPQERQRLADQRWVFGAHRDHIHVAR